MKTKFMNCAAVICLMTGATLFHSCVKDNPVGPQPYIDEGEWTVDETLMDKSYKPGDNFYMYCNGGFWKNTEVDDAKLEYKGNFAELGELQDERVSAMDWPAAKILANAVKRLDQTKAQAEARIQEAMQLIDGIKTREEAWTIMGQLTAMGFQTPIYYDLFSRNSKMMLFITMDDDIDFEELTLTEGFKSEMCIAAPTDKNRKSMKWRLKYDPGLLSKMQAIDGGAETRGLSPKQWPMLVAVSEGMGLPTDLVYTILSDPDASDDKLVREEKIENLEKWQQMDVAQLVNELKKRINDDASIVSSEAFAAMNSKRQQPVTMNDVLSGIIDSYLIYDKARHFTDTYITPNDKVRTLDISEKLRQTFRERIAQSEWMSEGSKQSATEKLDAMVFNVAYPDVWYEEGFPKLVDGQSLLEDLLAMRRAKLDLNKRLMGMSTQRACFHALMVDMDLTIANACYCPNFNSMNIFPIWMLKPNYDPMANIAQNYSIFCVIGHEMTHGFDTNGSMFDKNGDAGDLFNNNTADRQEYLKRAQQLKDCYSAFEVMPDKLPGLHADGDYTITENIADLGGFQIAYNTYLKKLKADGVNGEQYTLQRQYFYRGYANLWRAKYSAAHAKLQTVGDENGKGKNIHSLARERINGVVINIDDWYTLFSVHPGQDLYRAPSERVLIW